MRVTGFRSFTRAVMAVASAAGGEQASDYAKRKWGAESGVAHFLEKAGVGGIISTSPMSAIGANDDEFFSAVFEASLIGRMRTRGVPFNVRLLNTSTSARGYWVGQSKPIPLSKQVLEGSSLPRRKVGAIIVASKESLDAANTMAEARLDEDMRNALVMVLDEAFIDETNAGITDEMPAAVTYNLGTASSGNPATDVATLIASFSGDLSQAVFVTDPVTAAEIGLSRDSGGSYAFPNVGPRGGQILGVPVLTSNASPRDSNGGQLALIDPSGIASNLESIEVARSTQATLEMADDPTGETDTPAAMTKTPVSLFQADCVAFRATIHGNWETRRPAVAVVTAASYPTEIAS
jgi:hypothetical protein